MAESISTHRVARERAVTQTELLRECEDSVDRELEAVEQQHWREQQKEVEQHHETKR